MGTNGWRRSKTGCCVVEAAYSDDATKSLVCDFEVAFQYRLDAANSAIAGVTDTIENVAREFT
ncbi:hypothetical protein RRSWK_04079 [Rhodopirellula sp. SWK7]|nr:hypothetical protein RRSWK_04079 [Rhodopirellula sp. SWK7]